MEIALRGPGPDLGRRLMCGIAGVMSTAGDYRVTPELVTAMRETMVHRGPDGPGLWMDADGRVGTWVPAARDHRPQSGRRPAHVQRGWQHPHRLQRRGLQPRRDPSRARGDRWAHLGHGPLGHGSHRPRVRAVGHRRAWSVFGACSRSPSGMLGSRHSGWSATGSAIKPLYYPSHRGPRLRSPRRSRLCSKDPDQRRAVDEEALFHYLSFVSTPAPMTLFDGIRKVPPGHMAAVSARMAQSREQRWWDVWDHTDPLDRRGRGGDRGAGAGRAPNGRSVPQGQRRPGRRLPLRRHRLEHQRGALL